MSRINPNQKGYTVLVIMIVTSVILLGFSFWLIKRRTNIPVSPAADISQTTASEYDWTDFISTDYGVHLRFPQNIFTTSETKAMNTIGATRLLFARQ